MGLRHVGRIADTLMEEIILRGNRVGGEGISRRDSFLTVEEGACLVNGLKKTGKTSDRRRAIPFNYI